jgi:hypothetical protein
MAFAVTDRVPSFRFEFLGCNELHRYAANRDESNPTLYAQLYTRLPRFV